MFGTVESLNGGAGWVWHPTGNSTTLSPKHPAATFTSGWSSLEARVAHNHKVVGSIPTPDPTFDHRQVMLAADLLEKSNGSHEQSSPRKPLAPHGVIDRAGTTWARNGFDSLNRNVSAGRGCLVGHVKSSRQKQTTTSLPWTSLVKTGKSLSQLNNCEPGSHRCSLVLNPVAASKTQPSTVRNLLAGGTRVSSLGRPQACKSGSYRLTEDPGSNPGASTTFHPRCRGSKDPGRLQTWDTYTATGGFTFTSDKVFGKRLEPVHAKTECASVHARNGGHAPEVKL